MSTHVCPWWLAYTFDNPLRRLIHKPESIFRNLVTEGMIVADLGCGLGYFSIGMAKLVGPSGRVWSLDIQNEMLTRLMGRAKRAGVADRITPRLTPADRIDLEAPVDFVLAFWMLHETPHPETFLGQVFGLLKPGGQLLVTEPWGHVTAAMLSDEIEAARRQGFQIDTAPQVAFSRTALLWKPR